jgi:hypothetical protein
MFIVIHGMENLHLGTATPNRHRLGPTEVMKKWLSALNINTHIIAAS